MRRKHKPFFFRPSTRSFIKEARRTKGFSIFDWIHGYVYGRWPYLYIGIGTGEHSFSRIVGPAARKLIKLFSIPKSKGISKEKKPVTSFRRRQKGNFSDKYHGKVVTHKAARDLVMIRKELDLTNLEQIVPYPHARDIILKNPHHIVALECPCRASRSNPCQPLDVCLIVGEPFASFVAEHHPNRSRWLNSDEVLEILQAEHERGHVHHAFFKDAMLGRFYAICNCCRCCCGAMQAFRNGVPMLASSGYISLVEKELCEGCENCVASCPFGAISMNEKHSVVDTALCMGCGVCVSKCEKHAHSLILDPDKGEPLEILKFVGDLD